MAVRYDPEGAETSLVINYASPLTERRVLEIGCGDGRLTWRYASLAGSVVAIDPKADYIDRAKACLREQYPDLGEKTNFLTSTLEEFSRQPAAQGQFNRVILAWSL